jgi:hypothetical protein
MKNLNDSGNDNDAALELPDWSGMEDSGLKVDGSLAVRLCEEYYARLPDSARSYLEERRSRQVYTEFVL